MFVLRTISDNHNFVNFINNNNNTRSNMFEELRKEIISMGACDLAPNLIPKVTSPSEMIDIMLMPECIEFCMKHKYPALPLMKKHESLLRSRGIYISDANIRVSNSRVLIYSGHVEIIAQGYDVLEVYICGGSVNVVAKDDSIVTVEKWGGRVATKGSVKIYNKK